MKKLFQSLLVAIAMVITAPSALAQLEWSAGVDYMSPYVWRGQVFSTGFVFQPYIEASYQGFAVGFWGNLDPNSIWLEDHKFHVQEADLYASYSTSVNDVDLSVGYTLYTFPDPTGDELEFFPTHEFFASIGLTSVPLSPSLFVAYDVDAIQGLYAELAVGQEFSLGSQPVGLGLAVGFDNDFLLEDGSGLTHLALTASTDFDAGRMTISPIIGLQIGLDDAYDAALIGNRSTFFYGGIGIGF